MKYLRWFIYDTECPAWVDFTLAIGWLLLIAAEHAMGGWSVWTTLFGCFAGLRFERTLQKLRIGVRAKGFDI